MEKGEISESTKQKKACGEVPPPTQLDMLVKQIVMTL